MTQLAVNDIELNHEWSVKFMVKMREKQGCYRQHDFIGNFIDIGQKSKSLFQILKNVRNVPNFDDRQRGILSIFRDNIQPVYEDSANTNGFYIRFMMMKDEASLNKSLEELSKLAQELQNDQKKWEQQVRRRLAPVINPCDDIINNFIFMGLSGVLSPNEGMFNGIYTHIEEGIIKLDFWYDKKAKESSKQQILAQFNTILKEIDDKYKFQGPNEKQYSLSDTLQDIDMIDYNYNKKQNHKQKNK